MPALAAGGHYDPAGSKHHSEPWGDGHLGDLPALSADANGSASPILAPRLKMADFMGRGLMIHAGGDNYADQPAPVGGGGDPLGLWDYAGALMVPAWHRDVRVDRHDLRGRSAWREGTWTVA